MEDETNIVTTDLISDILDCDTSSGTIDSNLVIGDYTYQLRSSRLSITFAVDSTYTPSDNSACEEFLYEYDLLYYDENGDQDDLPTIMTFDSTTFTWELYASDLDYEGSYDLSFTETTPGGVTLEHLYTVEIKGFDYEVVENYAPIFASDLETYIEIEQNSVETLLLPDTYDYEGDNVEITLEEYPDFVEFSGDSLTLSPTYYNYGSYKVVVNLTDDNSIEPLSTYYTIEIFVDWEPSV